MTTVCGYERGSQRRSRTPFDTETTDGTAVENTALTRQPGWAQNRYWYARDYLLEVGAPVRAKGRGAVRRVQLNHDARGRIARALR